jgi:hypothetical protein
MLLRFAAVFVAANFDSSGYHRPIAATFYVPRRETETFPPPPIMMIESAWDAHGFER